MIRSINRIGALLSGKNEAIVIHRPTLIHVIGLAAIIILAAFVRFYNPFIIDWSSDHSDMALLAQDMATGKNFPLVGQPSSSKFPHSPFYIYPLAIPYLFTNNPVIVTAFITILNLINVVLIWFIAFRYFGPVAATAAALAFAVHPWGVGYGRSIWSGDHRSFLLLIGIILGLRGFLEGKRLAQLFCLPVMLIAVQIHYAAWPLIALYLWMAWSGRQKMTPVVTAISIVLGLLTILPFGIGIYQTLTDPVAPVTPQPLRRELTLREIIKPSGQMLWLATGLGTEQYVARPNADDLLQSVGWLRFLWLLQGAAAALGLWVVWQKHARIFAVLLSIWVLLPLIIFTFPIIAIMPHYFIPVIPALCLLFGIGFAWVVETIQGWRPRLAPTVWVLYSLIVVTQVQFIIFTYDYINTYFTPTQFSFATPVSYFLNASIPLRTERDLIFITSSDWLDHSRTGAHVWEPFVRDSVQCLRDIPVGSKLIVFPAQPFVAVFAPRINPDHILSTTYQQGRSWEVPLRIGEGSYQFYRLEQANTLVIPPMIALPLYHFENGVQLIGYQLNDSYLYLEWQLPDRSRGEYSYQIEYLDQAGRILDTQRLPFWAAKNWCANDRLITWSEVKLLPDYQTLRVTFIREGTNTMLTAYDPTGDRLEDGISISLPSK